jgi:hypothetical protein
MPTTLHIPDRLYKRLQKHAIPFVDLTPVSVIERLVDNFEKSPNGSKASIMAETPVAEYGAKKLDPLRPPDLFHTRARGTFGSAAFSNWNDLVRVAHIQAFRKAGSFDELRHLTHAQIHNGKRSDSGYRFVPEVDVSIQGVDANHAWAYSIRLAKYLHVPLRAIVEWRHNAKAAYPGESGILEFAP